MDRLAAGVRGVQGRVAEHILEERLEHVANVAVHALRDAAFWNAADDTVEYGSSGARKGVGELDIIPHGLRALFSVPRISFAIFLALVPGVSVAWRALVQITCTASYNLRPTAGQVHGAWSVLHGAWSVLQSALSLLFSGRWPPYTSAGMRIGTRNVTSTVMGTTPQPSAFLDTRNVTPPALDLPAQLLVNGEWVQYTKVSALGESGAAHTEVSAPGESVQTLLDVMRSGTLVKWVALGASAVLVLVAIEKLRLDELQLDLQSEARDVPESERLERALGAMERMVDNLPRYAGSAPVRWASQFRAAHLGRPPHRAD